MSINNQLDDLLSDDASMEAEEDLGPAIKDTQAVVTATDWTTETILNQLRRGNIKLNPRFQRRDAWKPIRKSRFIESLILGLPIPQIVLAEEKNKRGSYLIIDGKQRLLTLMQFSKRHHNDEYTPLKLKGLENRKDLNGFSMLDMENKIEFIDDLTAFQNQTIRTVVIKNWPNEDFLYLVFHRLNTGSLPLSPQELRQALHPGEFINFVDDFSQDCKLLQKILNNDKPDFRMRDVELVVRYYAYRNFITTYEGNLKSFLDETCKQFNEQWPKINDKIVSQSSDFENAIKCTISVFGVNSAFKKWSDNKYENRFNRAIFDIMLYYFSDSNICEIAKNRKIRLKKEFEKLCSTNNDFLQSIETTTKSIQANFIRFSEWGKIIKRVLGVDIVIPRLIDNRLTLQ